MEIAAKLKVVFESGYSLCARWPAPSDPDHRPRTNVHTVRARRRSPAHVSPRSAEGFPEIASSSPVLKPVGARGVARGPEITAANRHRDARQGSRFFRNELYQYEQQSGNGFDEFAKRWLEELDRFTPVLLRLRKGGYLDLFYNDSSPREKELFWAGDAHTDLRAVALASVSGTERVDRCAGRTPRSFSTQTLQSTSGEDPHRDASSDDRCHALLGDHRRGARPFHRVDQQGSRSGRSGTPDPSILEELSTSLGCRASICDSARAYCGRESHCS